MRSFIKKASNISFICQKCEKETLRKTGKSDIFCENLYSHILSDTHQKNTKNEEEEDYEKLKQLIQDKHFKNKKKTNKKVDEEDYIDDATKDNGVYLSFVAFLLAERLSFLQVAKIGKYIQRMIEDGEIDRISNFSFSAEQISKLVTKCYRPTLIEEIQADLKNSQFSFSLDSSTMVGESLCAVKVKYWKNETNKNHEITSKLQDKLLSITYLKESSNAQTMFRLVKENLLTEDLQSNFIGYTHDNAESLASQKNGLAGLLKKEVPQFFFDLPDPSHCLSLAIKHSLKNLPDNIIKFIDDIHHYFSFPQRKALLKRLQDKEGSRNPLVLKKYVLTRWMSLGESLDRLILIWDDLKIYMDYVIENKKNDEVKKIMKFYFLLNNNIFKLKIYLLRVLVNQINILHQKLQTQEFNVGCLSTELKLCFQSIFKLICSPEKFETPFKEIINENWDDENIQSQYFLKGEDFIKNLHHKVHHSFIYLETTHPKLTDSFINIFYQFIGNLLNQLKKYLPFTNEVLHASSFIELKDSLPILEDKLMLFNQIFNLVSENELKFCVFPQLLRLREFGFENFQRSESDNALTIWQRIEKTGKYPSLVKFFRLSQILPVSSSNVEQSFSTIKLFMTEKRNMLSNEALEGLLLIHQKYSNFEEIQLPVNIDQSFLKMKEEMNQQKNQRQKLKKTYAIREEERKNNGDQEELNHIQFSQTLKKSKKNIKTESPEEDVKGEIFPESIIEITYDKALDDENLMIEEENRSNPEIKKKVKVKKKVYEHKY